jgi:uncharacterized protein
LTMLHIYHINVLPLLTLFAMVKVKIRRIEWDEHNIVHIARHNVLPSEVEEACTNEVVKLESTSHPTRIVLIGKTQNQRTLRVVFEPKTEEVWRTVTAHDASRKDRRLYTEVIGGEEVA